MWSNHRTTEGDENTEGTMVSGLSEFSGSAIQWTDRGKDWEHREGIAHSEKRQVVRKPNRSTLLRFFLVIDEGQEMAENVETGPYHLGVGPISVSAYHLKRSSDFAVRT